MSELEAKKLENTTLQEKILELEIQIVVLEKDNSDINIEKNECLSKIGKLNEDLKKLLNENKILNEMKNENVQLFKMVDEKDLGKFFLFMFFLFSFTLYPANMLW